MHVPAAGAECWQFAKRGLRAVSRRLPCQTAPFLHPPRAAGLAACALGSPLAPSPQQRHQQHAQQQQRRSLRSAPPPLGLPALAPASGARRQVAAASSYAGGYDPLVSLGTDFLTFLVATVLVVPVFKSAKQSPVLGYLFAGLVLGQLG